MMNSPGSRWNAGRRLEPGVRVMVRRRLREGDTSHLLTDVLGQVESVEPLRVRTKAGAVVEIPEGDIQVLKVLPPRPVLVRDVRNLTHAVALGWPGTEHEIVSGWLCRAGDTWSYRHGAAVPVEPWALDADLSVVTAWYRDRGLEPWLELPHRLIRPEQLGLEPVEGSGELEVRTAPIAELVAQPVGPEPVSLRETPSAEFLAGYHATAGRPSAQVLPWLCAHTDGLAFAHLLVDGRLAAFARGAISAAPSGLRTLGISCVETTPEFRRRGLARDVVVALAHWAAEQGASLAQLHVFTRNTTGMALWDELGFVEHHRTRHVPLG